MGSENSTLQRGSYLGPDFGWAPKIHFSAPIPRPPEIHRHHESLRHHSAVAVASRKSVAATPCSQWILVELRMLERGTQGRRRSTAAQPRARRWTGPTGGPALTSCSRTCAWRCARTRRLRGRHLPLGLLGHSLTGRARVGSGEQHRQLRRHHGLRRHAALVDQGGRCTVQRELIRFLKVDAFGAGDNNHVLQAPPPTVLPRDRLRW
jgi:hypothetical protein